eukprot:TRINITY_DN4983_c0_g1_i1.p1 TRINITY_DN4983_c0_g1~~TRINITY_DN4983_c0_g1_i1.p1  ORF type:complete len:372 (-),score=110.02 TRINITY_DN4983_c0_g1_i1:141-1256(-)
MQDKQEEETTVNRTVFVRNISPKASEKSVGDFFAFCGIITSITIRRQPDSDEGLQEAIVEFKDAKATEIAKLLTNALIIDRPITVTLYSQEAAKAAEAATTLDDTEVTVTGDEIQNKKHALPASQRSHTSVIASLVAAGYELANGTLEKARAVDDQHKISATVTSGLTTAQAKASELDKEYKISETASSFTNSLVQTVAAYDQTYGISEAAKGAYTATSDAVKATAATAAESLKPVTENPTVVSTVGTIKATSDAVVTYAAALTDDAKKYITEQEAYTSATDAVKTTTDIVKGEYESLRTETKARIAEQEQQKVPAATTTTTATTSDEPAAETIQTVTPEGKEQKEQKEQKQEKKPAEKKVEKPAVVEKKD